MNLMQFFQDGTGENSNMRLLVAIVVIAIVVTWVAANIAMAWNAMHGGHLAIVPMDDKMLWAIGIALSGKVAQAAVENKSKAPGAPEQK